MGMVYYSLILIIPDKVLKVIHIAYVIGRLISKNLNN